MSAPRNRTVDADDLHCRLCLNFDRLTPATVVAGVPMAGHYPRYPLCDDCLSDIEAYVEGVEVLPR